MLVDNLPLKCEGFSWRARKGHFVLVFYFFFKWGHPDVLSHVFFIVSSLLYNKNCYANVYAVKGRKKPTPSSRAECCDPDKALNLQKQWPCACDSTRATSYCLQHTPSCSFSATRGIITLDLLIVDFFCIGT